MSEAIRHESDETPARAKRTFGSHFVDKIANGPHHFKILPFAVAANVISLPYPAPVEYGADGRAVVRHK
jgi:hypothetical protein